MQITKLESGKFDRSQGKVRLLSGNFASQKFWTFCTDQLRSYWTADLRLCFCICQHMYLIHSEHPFHLTRRGWGEFPVRVQLHFKDSRNKRLDIIHNLKVCLCAEKIFICFHCVYTECKGSCKS